MDEKLRAMFSPDHLTEDDRERVLMSSLVDAIDETFDEFHMDKLTRWHLMTSEFIPRLIYRVIKIVRAEGKQ